jgi:hypothetical protein
MKSKTLGYVILAQSGDGFKSAPEYKGDKSTLWFGSHLSLFATKKQAIACLERTRKFVKMKDYDWPWIETAQIHKVKAAQ